MLVVRPCLALSFLFFFWYFGLLPYNDKENTIISHYNINILLSENGYS